MEKVCPWCGQPSDRGPLKNRREQHKHTWNCSHVNLRLSWSHNDKEETYLSYGTSGRLANTLQMIVCALASMHQTVGQNFSLNIGQYTPRNERILSPQAIVGF